MVSKVNCYTLLLFIKYRLYYTALLNDAYLDRTKVEIKLEARLLQRFLLRHTIIASTHTPPSSGGPFVFQHVV